MSYSRWTNSEFYTFWSGSGATKKEDEEFCCMFSLDSAPHFCYSEVKEMIKNPGQVVSKIMRAQEFIEQNYSPKAIAKKWEQVYENISRNNI